MKISMCLGTVMTQKNQALNQRAASLRAAQLLWDNSLLVSFREAGVMFVKGVTSPVCGLINQDHS